MAQLPSERRLIRRIGGEVALFNRDVEEVIVRFDPSDADATARAQKVISNSDLTEEDKAFAHFWCGYFYAHA